MKKGQIVDGYVEKVNFPNKGIVAVTQTDNEGKESTIQVQVKGVIPGQRVRLAIKKARKDKCQGILKEVLATSSLETAEPACPRFGTCGGCSYQTLPYENQLEMKKSQVLDLIYPVCPQDSFKYDGIFGSPSQWEYRNKMEFSFGDEYKNGPLALGLHKKGSFYDIVQASGCRIVSEDFSQILDCVLSFCQEQGWSYYRKTTHEGLLRHLLVRQAYSTGEMLVALVTSSQIEIQDELQLLSARLQQLELKGSLKGFLHILNDSMADVVQSDHTEILCGQDWFMEEILGLHFRITPFSFFQTNTKGAELLYQKAREYILGMTGSAEQPVDFRDKTVFDLYSGTGTIAQIIAPVAKKVIGVEIVEEAVESARENAQQNGLDNCEFIAGDVLKVIDEIEEKPDYIILDPPRDGIHPKALQKIIDYGVPQIVYISCKPTSLARDLEVLQAQGYQLERMCNVDLFANTVHVETVCLLSRKA